MYVPKDPFDVRIGSGGLKALAQKIAAKHGVSVHDITHTPTPGRRDKHIMEAVGEFCYEAYKTGVYSLTAIAAFCNVRGRRGNRTIDDRISSYCNRHGIERPRWGIRTKPFWRIFDEQG